MNVGELPAEVLDLVDQRVRTMAQVEILLLLQGAGERAWSAVEVARAVRVDAAVADRELALLGAHHLVARSGDAYRYAPQSPAVDAAVGQLRIAYETRPVTLVRAIYERPARPAQDVSAPVRSFADAFRIRKPGE